MSGRKMMGVTGVLALIFLIGIGFKANATEIKIGVAMGLSGPPAIVDFAEAAMQGIKLAVKEYNTNGGCKGQPVKLVVYDDESNPKRAVEIATRLITHDKVLAMMGTVNSGNVLAFMHLNQQHRIPLMAGPSIASPITDRYQKDAKNYIFRGSMREEYQINAILDYAVKKSKKIALIHSTTGYGMFAKEELIKGMKARGRGFLAVEAHTVGGGDSTTPLLKIKNAGAEVVLFFVEDLEVIGKVRSKLNYYPLIIGNWGLSGYKTFNLIGKPLMQGIMMGQTVDVSEPRAAATDKKFRAEYGSKYDWPAVTFLHYDGARVLLKALDMAGPNPEAIRDALEKIDNFEAATTAVPKKPFSKEDHEILDPKGVFLGVWKDDIVVRATN